MLNFRSLSLAQGDKGKALKNTTESFPRQFRITHYKFRIELSPNAHPLLSFWVSERCPFLSFWVSEQSERIEESLRKGITHIEQKVG